MTQAKQVFVTPLFLPLDVKIISFYVSIPFEVSL